MARAEHKHVPPGPAGEGVAPFPARKNVRIAVTRQRVVLGRAGQVLDPLQRVSLCVAS